MRKIVIGDIHGALKALKQVLERCKYSSLRDQLIFVGDYSDGWSETAELVSYLLDLQKIAKHKPIFICGNHDIWVRDWLNSGHKNPVWEMNGGQATIDSYIKTGLVLDEAHKDFYKYLTNWYIDDDNNLFIHAGWEYIEGDFVVGATMPRGTGGGIGAMACHWDRSLVQSAFSVRGLPDAKFDKLNEFNQIFIGHTTTENWTIKPHLPEYKHNEQPRNGKIIVPMNAFNLWNVDTGAGWTGKLTAMDINTKEFWQSDFCNELYPNDKGRGDYKPKYHKKK